MDKRPEAMTEQDQLLNLQMKLKKETRVPDLITVLLFLCVIIGFAIAMFIIPDNEFSEQENRYLQQTPQVSTKYDGSFIDRIKAGKFLDRIISGKFMGEVDDYYADQFPARDLFVGAKAVFEIALLKNENNNIILGSDGYIAKRFDYADTEMVNTNIATISEFAAVMKNALNVPLTVALAGRNVDVLQRFLPAMFPNERADKVWQLADNLFYTDKNLSYINLKIPLAEIINGTDEQLYYRTDHHWTTLGAFYAYTEIMKEFGIETQTLDKFTIEAASDSFYGTSWSSAGYKWIKPDTINFFRYEGDDSFTTEIVDTGVKFDGFYDYSYLDKKDKYSSFIAGNNARVNVYKTDGTDRDKLLLIKDSFAHSLAPFLAYHYDLVILDLRYYKNPVSDIVKNEGIDRILIMNNIDGLTEKNVFGILRYGLSN